MTEYYWVLQADLNGMSMFWHNDEYFTVLVNVEVPEDKIVGVIKCVAPQNVTHIKHTIRDFDPKSKHLPETKKMLVVLEVSDGLTKVGPIWMGSVSPEEYLRDVVPSGYYKIGDPPSTDD